MNGRHTVISREQKERTIKAHEQAMLAHCLNCTQCRGFAFCEEGALLLGTLEAAISAPRVVVA